jgi:hypothetical protein
MVGKSILLEVCEDDGCEGGEEGGALVYRAVVDRFPYLISSVERCIAWRYQRTV